MDILTAIALMTVMAPVVVLLTLIAYYTLLPKEYMISNGKKHDHLASLRIAYEVLPYILLVSVVYILAKSQETITAALDITPTYTIAHRILLLEGSTVSLFQTIASPALTYLSAFIYLFGFSFLLIFTFVALICTGKISVLQEYAIAVAIAYLIAFPFQVLAPVSITGYTLPNVVPLLYQLSPVILDGLRSVDPYFDNCFPSLHAALSIIAMLLIVLRTNLMKYKVVAVLLTLSIQFTIFYLGIHWITDFFGGLVLAVISCGIAIRYRDRIVKRIRMIRETVHPLRE
ncbi:MAG: phosphatase PAP2 family protein [Methanolobus sp.]|uniref:phosphatase PAP2 family protein n=1 Tax=Methanolobus sp. TaxID=1874737 RepID=UPI00272FDBE7|nr:phosphatase PAP2 family protein [Methanolobus sp.]MDP2216462.1 phosphatase PAP2 family protein [Methanolobus sp.]